MLKILFFDVVVVGIFNWVLDVVKMNCVIYLLWLEFDVEDLYEIGILLWDINMDLCGIRVLFICIYFNDKYFCYFVKVYYKY